MADLVFIITIMIVIIIHFSRPLAGFTSLLPGVQILELEGHVVSFRQSAVVGESRKSTPDRHVNPKDKNVKYIFMGWSL
jgi:hypothetical protein